MAHSGLNIPKRLENLKVSELNPFIRRIQEATECNVSLFYVDEEKSYKTLSQALS